jgi:hypothetical protein
MKKLYIFILLILFSLGSKVMAQAGIFSLQYSVAYTVGDFNDFIGSVSWRGTTVEYRNLITPNIGVGFELGWNGFYQDKGYDTYTIGTESLSGKQYGYCSSYPMLAAADYYFMPDYTINPFIGLGIGTQYTNNELDMGLYYISEHAWHFDLRPEAGIIINPGAEVGIIICAKYFQAFKTGDIKSRSYFTTNIGFAFNL